MADTNTHTNSEPQKWPVWVMASLAFILILCWIITVCAPGIYRKFLDIILWIFLFFSGISRIINAFKNEQKYVWCLIALWALASILWILMMFSNSTLIWTLTIWAFAFWALIRWCILVYYGLTNKEGNKFWRWIIWLWILLIVLFFIIAFSNKWEAKALAWICIWISTIFDWILLLIMSFRINNNPSLQDQLVEQANQNEIANTSTTPTSLNDINTTATPAQPSEQATNQPAPATQPEAPAPVAVPVPVAVPTPESQAPAEAQATTETPVEQSTPTSEPTPVTVPTPEAQTTISTPVEQSAQATEPVPVSVPTPKSHPANEAQPEQSNEATPTVETAPAEENKTEDNPTT